MRENRRSLQAVGVIGLALAVWAVGSGCRQESPEPRYNRNLGDKPGELMPLAASPADARILLDQKNVTEDDFGGAAKPAPKEESTDEEGGEKKSAGPRDRKTPPEPSSPAGKTKKTAPESDASAATREAMKAQLLKRAQQKQDKSKAPTKSASKPPSKATEKTPAKPEAKEPAAKTTPKKPEAKTPAKSETKKPTAKTTPSAKKTSGKTTAAPKKAAKPISPLARAKSATAGTGSETSEEEPASGRSVNALALKLPAPWKQWKPPTASGAKLIAAYTQRDVADVAAWSIPIPKGFDPEKLKSKVGRIAIVASLKQQAEAQFKQIDRWKPLDKTVVIDGVEAIEVGCTLKKGPVAGAQRKGKAVAFGVIGRTKGFLVMYMTPADAQDARVRKAVLDGIELK